jgi:putative transcriptional regulator
MDEGQDMGNKPGGIEPGFLGGKLLIAMPGIGDPRFDRTVIYLCTHSKRAAMGLIINRPAPDIAFPELLGQLDIAETDAGRRPRIRIGGPVERSRGFVLHSSDYALKDATVPVTPAISMTASIDILKDLATGKGPEQAFLALGYSGWGPGQLEREIRANGWLVADPDAEIVFGDDDKDKWQAALALIGIDPRLLSGVGGKA